MKTVKLHIQATSTKAAQALSRELIHELGNHPLEDSDYVIAIGGDGHMLGVLGRMLASGMTKLPPVYGVNLGTVGFLLNNPPVEAGDGWLQARLAKAIPTLLTPLDVTAWRGRERIGRALAINDVAIVRAEPQTAHLKITVDGKVRIEQLIGDGVLIATPAGSTAYNQAAGGPILPLGTPALALTPICAASPRRWPGALLPENSHVRIDVLDGDKRPVYTTADSTRWGATTHVDIKLSDRTITVLFDPGHQLEERIISAQFPDIP
jgi:NAD+ kinase